MVLGSGTQQEGTGELESFEPEGKCPKQDFPAFPVYFICLRAWLWGGGDILMAGIQG